MNASTTMTIRVSVDLKAKLDRLADGTRRSKSWLAAEAVATYVERELAIIEGIHRGEAELKAGFISSHADVMAAALAVIEETGAASQ